MSLGALPMVLLSVLVSLLVASVVARRVAERVKRCLMVVLVVVVGGGTDLSLRVVPRRRILRLWRVGIPREAEGAGFNSPWRLMRGGYRVVQGVWMRPVECVEAQSKRGGSLEKDPISAV